VNPASLRDWYVKMFSGTKGKRGKALTAVFPGGEIDFEKVSTPPRAHQRPRTGSHRV
jgi:hypothetical protein